MSSRSGTSLAQSSAGSPLASSPTSPIPPAAASDLAPEELLRFVVDHVNHLLRRSYSLVDFDALKGTALLQVVDDVFATLQPNMQMDLEAVPPGQSVPRMLDFLIKTLGYRVPTFIQGSFESSFADAEPTVVYPTLYWVLTHMEQNEKRVYLSRFLQPLDIPDAIRAQDEDVRNLFQQHQQLRAAFIQAHRRVDALRSAFADPVETRRKVAALEEERDRLISYTRAAEKKLANVPDKDALLSASRSLRLAMEEETKLSQKYVEQQQALISAEARSTAMSNRLQNLRRDAADGRVEPMIRRLKDEIQTCKIKLDDQLPKEADAKQKENAALQKLLSEPLDMSSLQTENRQLDEALRKLHETIRERQRPGEDGVSISTIQQQVQRVRARKEEVLNELNTLQAENNRALNNIREREGRIAQLRAATNMLKADDFRQFANQVRAKKAASEGKRTRLADLRTEWGILTFTESVLKEQYDELDAVIGNLEGKLGLQGYSRTVEALSKLTHERDTIEEIKGKSLEELSRVVQDFTLAIREGRTKLAPMINELRSVRQTAAEVNEEWAAKKSQYEYQEGLLMEEVQKVDDEVSRLKTETSLNESMYHRLQVQHVVLAAQLRRVEEERDFREKADASLDPQYKTYGDYFAETTKMLELRTKDMQTRRRDVEENRSTNVQQVEWFNNLKKLMEAKIKSLSASDDAPGRDAGGIDNDIQQVFGGYHGSKSNEAGVDMLVLNNN